jgi:hypothetical protein
MPKKVSQSPWKPTQDRETGLVKTRVGSIELAAYDPEMMARVCDRIIHGETLNEICKPGSGLVSAATVRRWAMLYPEAARALMAAREESAFSLDDEALDAVRAIREKPGSPQNVRAVEVLVNHLRWVTARRNPRVYSEKAAVKITVPIQINTGLNLGEGQPAGGAGVDSNSVYTIEAKMVAEGAEEAVLAKDAATTDTAPLHRPSGAAPKKRLKE